MTNKTALQELIEYMKEFDKFDIGSIGECISKAQSLLEKEKNIIVDAVVWGAENEFGLTIDTAEDYFNQTFKQ